YPWPGNVRELRACMEHAVIFSSGSSVQVRDLPPSIKNWQPETVMIGAPLMPSTDAHPSQTPAHSVKKTSNLSVKEAEKQLILQALEECGGNRTAASLKLGISRRTLHRKLNEYQLQNL
ncbi:MAG: sigma-54-dependent Fis family transcriptional regulator, partial [Verrucomicrobia bacterium]|nr:sigma-54-dependent Fis family transcriptional regulator [Verrucomicrobiota bacterium]